MNRAENIVDALLEDEGAKEFLDRNRDLGLDAQLLAAIDETGYARDDIDGIEAYGIVLDEKGNVIDRCLNGQVPGRYGVSVHKRGGGLADIGEYETAVEAREVAERLRVLLPHVRIFYDEISPA